MGKYKISIAKSAEKELSGIPQNMAAKIMDKLEGLSANPYPFWCKKLKEFSIRWYEYYPFYRIRIGDYRVVYTVENTELRVLIVRIRHRREVYK